jgi:hypothetical protein
MAGPSNLKNNFIDFKVPFGHTFLIFPPGASKLRSTQTDKISAAKTGIKPSMAQESCPNALLLLLGAK